MKTKIHKGVYFVEFGINNHLEVDLFALLLKGDELLDEGDFVYYNSKNRTEPFNISLFGNKQTWMARTEPMSSDGSIRLEGDYSGDDNYEYLSDEYEILSERCYIDLSKINPKYDKIKIGFALFGQLFEKNTCINAYLKSGDNEFINAHYTIQVDNINHSAIEGLVMTRLDDNSWEIEMSPRTFPNGMRGIIDYLIDKIDM